MCFLIAFMVAVIAAINNAEAFDNPLFRVPTNLALKTIDTSGLPEGVRVFRERSLSDGEGRWFVLSKDLCSNADDQLQIAPNKGNDCWVATPYAPLIAGSAGLPAIISYFYLGYSANTRNDLYFFRNGRFNYPQTLSLNSNTCEISGLFSFGACNVVGYQGVAAYSETNKLPQVSSGGMSTAGGYFVVDNNYDGHLGEPKIKLAAYGIYADARATTPNYFAAGIESDCQNTTNDYKSVISTPNHIFGYGKGAVCFGLWAYPGGTKKSAAPADSTSAVGVAGDSGSAGVGKRWMSALVVHQTAIRENAGHYEAIKLGTNHEIDWFGGNDSAVARLFGNGTSIKWGGGPLLPETDGAIDIGSSSARVRDGYFSDKIGIGLSKLKYEFEALTSTMTLSPTIAITNENGSYGFLRLRSARRGPSKVDSSDELGQILFQGYAEGAYRTGASIAASVDSVYNGAINSKLIFNTANKEAMSIDSKGSIRMNAYSTDGYVCFTSSKGILVRSVTCAISDGNLKNVIGEFDASDKIFRLHPVYFKWKKEANRPEEKDFGLIAQEVLAIYPELVSKLGEDLAVDYAKLTVPLLAWAQRAEKKIAELEARLAALEAKR